MYLDAKTPHVLFLLFCCCWWWHQLVALITVAQVKAAEAEAESKYLSGVGVSRQRKAIVDGLRESVVTFSESIDGASAGALTCPCKRKVYDVMCFLLLLFQMTWDTASCLLR